MSTLAIQKLKKLYVSCIWALVLLILSFTFYGGFLIINYKKPSIEILSYLGSFLGGMFTVIAVLLAVKEYIIFKAHNGSDKFLEFITKTIRPIGQDIYKDFKILKNIYDFSKNDIKDDHLKIEYQKKLTEIKDRYTNLIVSLDVQHFDATYHNKWLSNKIHFEYSELFDFIEHFYYAIYFVDEILYGAEINITLDKFYKDNPFVKDIISEKRLGYADLTATEVIGLTLKIQVIKII